MITIFQNFIHVLIVLGIAWIAKKIEDVRTTDIDDDKLIEEESFLALGFRRAGLYLGIFIGLSGSLVGSTKGFAADTWTLLLDGFVVVVSMFVIRHLFDSRILHKIKNDVEIKKNNIAVGIAECGAYIATGFILNGAFTGEGGGILSAILFVALGTLSLYVLYLIYEWSTPYSIADLILGGNIAAAISICGIFIALGIILRASIAGPFISWSDDLKSFGQSLAFGIVALLVLRILVDKTFLPHTNLRTEIVRDKNAAALVLTEAVINGCAIIIAAAI